MIARGLPGGPAARAPGFLGPDRPRRRRLARYCQVGVGLTTAVRGRYKWHSP